MDAILELVEDMLGSIKTIQQDFWEDFDNSGVDELKEINGKINDIVSLLETVIKKYDN